MNSREFKGVWIPAEIYLSREVNWTAKFIYLEIDSFTSRDKPCYLSNQHFAELLGVSETQVSKLISKLISVGWIAQASFDGRKRYLVTLWKPGFDPSYTPAPEPEDKTDPTSPPGHGKSAFNKSSNLSTPKVKGSSEPELNIHNPSTLYKDIIQAYKEYFEAPPPEGRGMKFIFNGGVDGNAFKKIVEYLRAYTKTGSDEEAMDLWRAILKMSARLSPFLQGVMLKPTQIQYFYSQIIADLKNRGGKNGLYDFINGGS